jgi:hypothetical protein
VSLKAAERIVQLGWYQQWMGTVAEKERYLNESKKKQVLPRPVKCSLPVNRAVERPVGGLI